jgi:hypothetical protein
LDKKKLTREYNGNLSELRKIINSWDLIPNAPSCEFDDLNHKILSELDKGVDSEKLFSILQSELIVNYGLFDNEFDPTTMVSEITDWWNSKI